MGNLLYLVHRLPYPPNKGDKVRSYHLLRHLAARHRVFLGTFVDDVDDEVHLPTVRAWCADLHAVTLNPRAAKLRSLAALRHAEALSLRYYADAGMHDWVAQVRRLHRIDAVVVFSSVMAQYVHTGPAGEAPMLVDFVDVDSAKWTQFAGQHRWPMSWLYRREGERLLAFEREVAQRAQRSFFVTEAEAALFRGLAPESAAAVDALCNGVDADFFSPAAERASPFQGDGPVLVFTGAMDYWPNVDAMQWFVAEMLPALRQRWPGLRLCIVGRSPTPAIQALAGAAVQVTGTVADVRAYVQHATVVVAPLRVARGVQNKILEAMAMQRPVVASRACVDAIGAHDGSELVAATEPADFVREIDALLQAPERAAAIGRAARQKVVRSYSWAAHLAGIDAHLQPAAEPALA